MDWPHDPDGEQGSEGRRQYGHAVLAKKINEEEDFPLSAADYVEQYGDHPIRIDYETVVSVEEIFGGRRERGIRGLRRVPPGTRARDARERLLVLRGC